MDLPRASQAPQPGMLFKASEDHSSPQLWTRDEVGGWGGKASQEGPHSSSRSALGQLAGPEQVDRGLTLLPLGTRMVESSGWPSTWEIQEPESVFTLLQAAVPL